MPAYLFENIPVRHLDNNGAPIPGVLLNTYAAGTLSPLATFTDSTGTVPLPNPIVSDAEGYYPQIWGGSGSYRLQAIKADSTIVWERDNVVPMGGLIAAFQTTLQGVTGAGQIGWAKAAYNFNTVGYKLAEHLSLHDFGGMGDGVTDDSAAWIAALQAGLAIYVPPGKRFSVKQRGVCANGTKLFGWGCISHDTSDLTDVLYAYQCADITIENVEIDGRKDLKYTTGNAATRGISVYGCARLRIQGVRVHNCLEHGIRIGLDGSDPVETDNPVIGPLHTYNNGNSNTQRGFGLWLFGKIRQASVIGVQGWDNEAGGMVMDDTSISGAQGQENYDVSVTGCNFVSNTPKNYGTAFGWSGTMRVAVTGCVGRGYMRGFYASSYQSGANSGQCSVTGGYYEGTVYGGELLDQQMVNLSGCTFVSIDPTYGNTALLIDRAYSLAGGENDIVIGGCKLRSIGQGISIGSSTYSDGNSQNIYIKNCVLTKTGTVFSTNVGITLSAVDKATVSGTEVTGYQDGIAVLSPASNVYLMDCKVRTSMGAGYRINNPSTVMKGCIANDGDSGGKDIAFGTSANVATTKLYDNHFISGTGSSGAYDMTTRVNNTGL